MADDGTSIEVETRSPPTDDEINEYIGQRIRLYRTIMGMRLIDLAAATGLGFRLIQKYEYGHTRIAADTLWKIARALKQPVEFFYEGLDELPSEA